MPVIVKHAAENCQRGDCWLVLDAIARIAKGDAQTARAPEPTIKVDPAEFTPALVNDKDLLHKTVEVFKEVLGPGKVGEPRKPPATLHPDRPKRRSLVLLRSSLHPFPDSTPPQLVSPLRQFRTSCSEQLLLPIRA